ncbi:MAG: carboxypeptidase regulatory-like domain-containing protein [Thermomicrobiales bacterium]|nr:carboxypeptidase regulatory-like domain-containing protein [Thermomicrobiales bacterium]
MFLVPVALLLATLFYGRLAGPPDLTIQVTDRYSAAPLAGAEITSGETTLHTDEQGLATLPVTRDSFQVSVRAPHYEPLLAEVDPAGAERWPVALRPNVVSGRLHDVESGAPIAGARISVVGPDGATLDGVSGQDGAFAFEGVPANAKLVVDAGDYGVQEQEIGQATAFDLSLKSTVVYGMVRDDLGAPLAGVRVATADGSAATATGADGAFRLAGGSGVGELLVADSGFAEQRLQIPANRQVDATLQREQIKSLYANANIVAEPGRLNELIRIANETEINAIVIDVKQDQIFYDTQVQFFRDVPNMVNPLYDVHEILDQLHQNNIYAIARMVVFKDPLVAEAYPNLAVKDEVTGGLWRDMNDAAWVNAFNEELWTANADLAAELAGLGFDEVQYDYIRFPSDGDLRTAEFGNDYTEDLRRAAITGAVALGSQETRANGAAFAIDLFPIIAIYGNDQGIGQTLQDLTPLADYVNLMIYPSHYERGNIPVDGHPNDFPAETVTYTLQRAEELVPGTMAKMRPWLQDFTYPAEGYSAYGPKEVRAQIDAAEAMGVSGWILWDAAGDFTEDALRPAG